MQDSRRYGVQGSSDCKTAGSVSSKGDTQSFGINQNLLSGGADVATLASNAIQDTNIADRIGRGLN